MSGDSSPEIFATHLHTVHGVSVLRVTGEIDMTSSRTVRGDLLTCLDMATSALVLDLSGVTFLASSGLALVIEAAGYADQHGIAFAVVAGHRAVLRPFQATNMDSLLTIHPDMDHAVTALRGTPATTPPSALDPTEIG